MEYRTLHSQYNTKITLFTYFLSVFYKMVLNFCLELCTIQYRLMIL